MQHALRPSLIVLALLAGCAAHDAPPQPAPEPAPATEPAVQAKPEPAPQPVAPARAQADLLHLSLNVSLTPADHRLEATATVTLPKSHSGTTSRFLLHAGLEVESATDGVTVERAGAAPTAADFGMTERDFPRGAGVKREHWLVTLPEGHSGSFALAYRGAIHHPIQELATEYARGFSLTPGLITTQGVYLASATWWTPWFGGDLFTFDLTTSVAEGWDTVSQGSRTAHTVEGGRRVTRWECDDPMEEVYLIAAQFTEYSRAAGAVTVQAFLRTPDAGMAEKYLEVTAQYLEMYRKLLGPYPFTKFALVENFWQTGYGMPSFTLLGDQIIRLPFILHSSYPHELLHNYWGNGVYVDWNSGNWCEGITAYMADHLVAEQRGQGAQYRRSTLQKFGDYVTPANDFPLRQFRSRRDSATEAIGYGKCLMLCNMLRLAVGDEAYVKACQRFYRTNKFKVASFDDLRLAFESVTDRDFKPFFEQWVGRPGAPALELVGTGVNEGPEGLTLSIALRQTQEAEAFTLEIPVAVTYADRTEMVRVTMERKSQNWTLPVTDAPLAVQVDPQFHLFRTLHPREVPPTLTRIFGATKIAILLPSDAPEDELARYRRIATAWSRDPRKQITVALDSDVEELPADAAVWLFGHRNRHRPVIEAGLEGLGAALEGATFRMGKAEFSLASQSCVVAVRHPADPASAVVLLTNGHPDATDGLARKLLHYGKYSALVFDGDEPTNIGKEIWSAVGSPLVSELEPGASTLPHARDLPKRRALARLAPVFSADRMAQDVKVLADPALEGRGVGTPGIEKAASYIAEQFAAAGLKPGGDDGSWYQPFDGVVGPDGARGTMKNVVAVLPGTNEQFAGQSAVLCAHYDHLGKGWPDAHAGDAGKIHPGADDNASGVAVMLEIARLLGKGPKPDRTIVFVAFSGEEIGLAGSRHYVRHMTEWPASKVMGALNLDTVGRLGNNKLLVINSGSAREWKFIFMGCGHVTGVDATMVAEDLAASDQVSFIKAGVPAVQFFSGPHGDYHRPGDTADKVDAAGMVKVATFVREALVYLAARPEPLTFTAAKAAAGGAPATAKGRRASTGSMPDFAFPGPGVKLSAVADGSPAHQAGLRKGDVLVRLGESKVATLREYSDALKGFAPGDTVEVEYLRDGKSHTASLTLAAR